ncbi:transcriptional regulator [Carnobacterium maltaromaticum]|uniref:helix-turn-helix domain-containing protein n=1 Tax=Carnobacterium maltaromaticum TaxID=2751 RepID=UPI0039BDD0BF
MNHVKKELGEKIRNYREQKKLSRENFCKDEMNLTVRQLARIETGESLPTLPKLIYISRQLVISVADLIGEKHMVLPKKYLDLKNYIIKESTYNKEAEIKIESSFDIIYQEFYVYLPEDEQLTIDICRSINKVHILENSDFGKSILEDYFVQIQNKNEYSVNDFLLVNLYFHSIQYSEFEADKFDIILKKVIEQIEKASEIELFLVNKILITIMGIFIVKEEYEKLIPIIKWCRHVMDKNKDYYKKPIVDMVEAKYWLHKGNYTKGNLYYKQAIQLAILQGSSVLIDKIEEEYRDDQNRI